MNARKSTKSPPAHGEALRACRERLENVLDMSSVWYWEQDENLRFTTFSGSRLGRSAFDVTSLIGKTRWAIPGIRVAPADQAALQLRIDAREPFRDFEYQRVDADGGVQHVSASGSPVFDASGRFTGYRGVATDITARKRAEQLLALEHAVNRCLAEANSVQTAMKTVLRAVCEMQGWECGRYFRLDQESGALRFDEFWSLPEAKLDAFIANSREVSYALGVGLIGRTWQSGEPLWAADIMSDPRSKRRMAPQAGLHGAFFFPAVADGRVIGVLAFHSRQVRQPDDRLLVAVRVIGSQIGQFLRRKQAEEDLQRFRAAIDMSEDLVMLADPVRLRYVDVNDAACRALGYSREELLTMGPQDFRSISREDLAAFYGRLIAGDLSETAVERSYRRKDGSQLVVESFRRAVPSGNGHVIVALARDIGERKRAEELQVLEHTVNRCLAEAESASGAIEAAIRAVCETNRWECGRYFRVDDEAGVLRFENGWNVADRDIDLFVSGTRGVAFVPGHGLAGKAWLSGEPIWASDLSRDPRVSQTARTRKAGMRSALVFPVTSEGTIVGVLAFNSREPRERDDRLMAAIRAIGGQIGQFVQRRRAEDDLRRFRIALDNSADLIVLIDRATMRFVDANDTVCRLLGYSRKELIALGPQDVLPVSREDLERSYDALIANPSLASGMKTYYRCKDGSKLPFESTRRVIRSGDSYIIAAISRDIRERLAAEEALRESEARFRALADLSSDTYWEQDEQYRFTSFAGKGIDRVSEASDMYRAYIGKKRWERGYINMTEADWAAHIAVLDARAPFHDLELCRVDDAGKKTWHAVSGEPIFDASGAFRGYRGVGKEITERKLGEERIQHLALHDALTSLPNRSMFSNMLSRALHNARRHNRSFAVLFVDLDGFKTINDSLGHEAGDKLLQEIAARLTDTLRSSDLVARLGGDEFVVLVEEIEETKYVASVSRKILAALGKPTFLNSQECRLTASIGICMYPADAQDERTLMKNADSAMYRAKEKGKNTFVFYSE